MCSAYYKGPSLESHSSGRGVMPADMGKSHAARKYRSQQDNHLVGVIGIHDTISSSPAVREAGHPSLPTPNPSPHFQLPEVASDPVPGPSLHPWIPSTKG